MGSSSASSSSSSSFRLLRRRRLVLLVCFVCRVVRRLRVLLFLLCVLVRRVLLVLRACIGLAVLRVFRRLLAISFLHFRARVATPLQLPLFLLSPLCLCCRCRRCCCGSLLPLPSSPPFLFCAFFFSFARRLQARVPQGVFVVFSGAVAQILRAKGKRLADAPRLVGRPSICRMN